MRSESAAKNDGLMFAHIWLHYACMTIIDIIRDNTYLSDGLETLYYRGIALAKYLSSSLRPEVESVAL